MKININDESYLYDVQGLLYAFLPEERKEEDSRLSLFVKAEEKTIEVSLLNEDLKDEASAVKASVPEGVDRPEYKNCLKRAVYNVLSEYTKKELPWGTLSGIRPVKIARKILEKGKNRESGPEKEAMEYMKSVYLCSDKKADLSVSIAKKEIEILDIATGGSNEKAYSLYIGIPFCPSTCLYCSFPSYPIPQKEGNTLVKDYIRALKSDIDLVSENMTDRPLTSVYFGGGTPTSLSAEELKELLSYLEEKVLSRSKRSHKEGFLEYTVEAGRPDSITKDKLSVLKEYGVNRISVNPQTLKEDTLRLIGRHHTNEDFYRAFSLAREEGFDAINTDIILGLPGETLEDLLNTLNEIERLKPDNLTVHSLAIKRSAKLNIDFDKYKSSYMENSELHMEKAHDTAKRLGMEPYYLYRQQNMAGNLENIGFSVPGKECIYNCAIIEEVQDIVALGAGAACKKIIFKDGEAIKTERCENVKDVDVYIERISEMKKRKSMLFL